MVNEEPTVFALPLLRSVLPFAVPHSPWTASLLNILGRFNAWSRHQALYIEQVKGHLTECTLDFCVKVTTEVVHGIFVSLQARNNDVLARYLVLPFLHALTENSFRV